MADFRADVAHQRQKTDRPGTYQGVLRVTLDRFDCVANEYLRNTIYREQSPPSNADTHPLALFPVVRLARGITAINPTVPIQLGAAKVCNPLLAAVTSYSTLSSI
jgi:hypothetical protein